MSTVWDMTTHSNADSAKGLLQNKYSRANTIYISTNTIMSDTGISPNSSHGSRNSHV